MLSRLPLERTDDVRQARDRSTPPMIWKTARTAPLRRRVTTSGCSGNSNHAARRLPPSGSSPGITVSLFDRTTAGLFSEQLFYRLNIIHLMAGDAAEARRHSMRAPLRRPRVTGVITR